MVTTQELRDWFLAHRDWCMDLIRIYLGLGLLAKGIAFVAHRDDLLRVMMDNHIVWSGGMLVHWVILTHIFGGLLMAMGIGTRAGALIQIPTLIGATFFVNWTGGIFGIAEEMRFSALVLFLLVMFVWYGAGSLSFEAGFHAGHGDVVPNTPHLRPRSASH